MINHRVRRPLLLALALCLGAEAVHAEDALRLTNQVFQEVEVTRPDGTVERRVVEATKVAPGDEVLYVISYRNEGQDPAEAVVITNPLVRELAYKQDSASATAATFEVSVDGGGVFGSLAALQVVEDDGARRPAAAADVTHLRWRLDGAVPPGAEGQVGFRAILR